MTAMLKALELPTLQDRREDQRLCFLFKVVRGLTPAIPPENYLTPVENRRRRKPNPRFADYQTTNIVDNHARNHQECFENIEGSTPEFKNSFFPRTIRNWNLLEQSTVNAPSVDSFRARLRRQNVI